MKNELSFSNLSEHEKYCWLTHYILSLAISLSKLLLKLKQQK